MSAEIDRKLISQITTNWSLIEDAHRVSQHNGVTNQVAQMHVLNTYGRCIFQYLLGATKNKDVADELSQEFAFRFLRGDLQKASPERGRFRDYLKAILRNLVNEHFRQRNKEKRLLEKQDLQQKEGVDHFAKLDEEFLLNWRAEILNRTWKALLRFQESRGNQFHSVLKLKADFSSESSEQLAERLSSEIGEPVRSDWIRQTLRRARQKFCQLLKEEIHHTLEIDAPEEALQTELAELKLLKYVRTEN